MKIYNSLTRKKEEFEPKGKEIKMYVCGPTVYDEPHIGHMRSAHIFDLIRRYFVYKGYKVKFVRNVTDVDDKIIEKAKKEFNSEDLNNAVKKISTKYLDAYHEALDRLNISADPKDIIEPKATEYIAKMATFIENLIERGVAYASEGDVYFDIAKAKDYGKLSNQDLDKLKEGARIQPGENKRNALDFALWKKAKEGEPSWDSKWGKGRPGWHIECSVMSSDILGDEFDIHGGGIDLIFPHHENEIAQSEGAGKKFANVWIHHGLLTINGQKMAKSLGNFVTVEDMIVKIKAQDNAKADILKDFFMRAHYSMPIDFSDKSIKESTEAIYSLLELLKIGDFKTRPNEDDKEINDNRELFFRAMDDNFNTPSARAAIFGINRRCNYLLGGEKTEEVKSAVKYGCDSIQELGKILGLSLPKLDSHDRGWGDLSIVNILSEEIIKAKIDERDKLRRERRYSEADKIRKELEEKGVILKDNKDGKAEWDWKR